jgi:hypothetical protein
MIEIFLCGEFDQEVITIDLHFKGLNGIDFVVGALTVLE